jgi:hypothetical protein
MEIIVEKGCPTADMLSFLLADGWTRIMSSDDDESLDIQEDVIGLVSHAITQSRILKS